MQDVPRHDPVLLSEVCTSLFPRPGERVLDVTLGLGGHARMFLEHVGPTGRLIGLDADIQNLSIARERLAQYANNVTLLHANFRELGAQNIDPVDIVFADLGLSSPHVDTPERGFTFRNEGPLDLRYDQTTGESASDFIARCDVQALATVFREYGELRDARRLAERLAGKHLKTTLQLRAVVEQLLGFRAPKVLPQVFQALRIAVNDELTALTILLETGLSLLTVGGRMGVISYHSLEDRLVKQTFRERTSVAKDPITGKRIGKAAFELLLHKPLKPSTSEIANNPRSRSAIFRAIQRLHP